MNDEIQIGKMIQEKMKEERRSANWLSEKLNCDSSNVYKIYKRSNIDVLLLYKISQILYYDFFSDISVIFKKKIYQ